MLTTVRVFVRDAEIQLNISIHTFTKWLQMSISSRQQTVLNLQNITILAFAVRLAVKYSSLDGSLVIIIRKGPTYVVFAVLKQKLAFMIQTGILLQRGTSLSMSTVWMQKKITLIQRIKLTLLHPTAY